MTIPEIIGEVQEKLGLEVDKQAGPKTWAAIHAKIVGDEHAPADLQSASLNNINLADPRSERLIATLLEPVKPYARSLIHLCAEHGIEIIVTSGTRTYAEQDALYEQGRSKPGKIVTNAKGGQSNHCFGIAWDVTIFKAGSPVWESPIYQAIGAYGKSIGLTWGGDWHFSDEPHFELRPAWAKDMGEAAMLAELRRRHAADEPAFA